ncbi:hypothetical protein VNO77_39514 [Canavalia gladiata]|uniref:Uncharacterized protein n=1 Tax=Canavalia gladiata TaxID=3824 RepID=A0AAN9PZV0_CANGL
MIERDGAAGIPSLTRKSKSSCGSQHSQTHFVISCVLYAMLIGWIEYALCFSAHMPAGSCSYLTDLSATWKMVTHQSVPRHHCLC